MLCRSAEQAFSRGLQALGRSSFKEAQALFETAIRIETQRGRPAPQPRYLSYYGLLLGLHNGRLAEGLRFCREAVEREFYNPDLYSNLATLLLHAGRRAEAWQMTRKGLVLQPAHPGLRRLLETMGRRRPPVLRFLSRRHPLNVLLGRLTWSLSQEPASREHAWSR